MAEIIKRFATPYRSTIDYDYDWKGNGIGQRRTYIFGVLVCARGFRFEKTT